MKIILENYCIKISENCHIFQIIVFNPHDFPDGSSGGVTEVLAMPQTETYVDVTAASFFSTSYVERFPREKRKCIFAKETQTKYGGTLYTYSDCIVDCKANEMYKLCGCRPFFYPRRGNECQYGYFINSLWLLMLTFSINRREKRLHVKKFLR